MRRVLTLSLDGMWVSDLNPLKGARWLAVLHCTVSECEKGLPNLMHLKGVTRGACSGGEKGEPILNIEGA